MKYSVIFLTFIILMSCQKQGSQTLTIEGQIYSKMDSTPFANTSFIVYEHIIGGTFGIKPYTGTTPFTTDHNGNFTVTIEPHVGSAFLLIDWPGGDWESLIVAPVYDTSKSLAHYIGPVDSPVKMGRLYTKTP